MNNCKNQLFKRLYIYMLVSMIPTFICYLCSYYIENKNYGQENPEIILYCLFLNPLSYSISYYLLKFLLKKNGSDMLSNLDGNVDSNYKGIFGDLFAEFFNYGLRYRRLFGPYAFVVVLTLFVLNYYFNNPMVFITVLLLFWIVCLIYRIVIFFRLLSKKTAIDQ